MFGAWNSDPGQCKAVLSKNRSADLFRRFVGISSPIVCVWGGGGLLMGCWRGYYNENTGTFWPDVQHLDYPTRKRGVRVSKEAGTHTLTPVHKG